MRAISTLLFLLFASPLALPASEFHWMVREFERQSGAHQTHIPFLGLAKLVVHVGHPAGTSQLELAVFEHVSITPEAFSRIADDTAGRGWKPMIRVRSRDGESSNIYVRPDGKQLKILITNLDGDDASFVLLRLKPEQLAKFVDEKQHHHHA